MEGGHNMSHKKLTLPDECIADLGYVKMYLNELSNLMQRYPDSITGQQQRFYIKQATELINKASVGIGNAMNGKYDEPNK